MASHRLISKTGRTSLLSGVLTWPPRCQVTCERQNAPSNLETLPHPDSRPFQPPPWDHDVECLIATMHLVFRTFPPFHRAALTLAVVGNPPAEVVLTTQLSPRTFSWLGPKDKEKSKLTFGGEVPKILRQLWSILFRGGFLLLVCLSGWFRPIYPGGTVGRQ